MITHKRYFSNKYMVLTHCLHLCKLRLHLCLMCEPTPKKPSCSNKHFRQLSNCKLFNSINMKKFKSSWLVCIVTVHFTFQDMSKACQNTPFMPICCNPKQVKIPSCLPTAKHRQLEIPTSQAAKRLS